MILKSLRYRRNGGTPWEWTIKGSPTDDSALQMGVINLIIGQNATGKSNTLQALRDLADLVSGEKKINALLYKTFSYDVLFDNDGTPLRYILEVQKGKVVDEKLTVGEQVRFDRQAGRMYYELQNADLRFEMAPEELGVTRIDSKQQKYLTPLYLWGRNLSHYEFGGTLGKNTLIRDLSIAVGETFKPRDTEKVSAVYAKAASLFAGIRATVLDDMREIGYRLTDIKSSPLKNIQVDAYGIAVKEESLADYTDQQEMSQGMFRALSIIIQIEYSLFSNIPSCILIDDIGEGLDYERSQKLIALIMRKAQANNLQVIMTTNDRFVMNNIPLQYWHVINRDGMSSVFYNITNSQTVFNEFAYTGLNNFDFFAKQFYLSGMEAFGG